MNALIDQSLASLLILGGTSIGVSWIFKGMMREAIANLVDLWGNKDKETKEMIYSVLGIEANKHHGIPVDSPPPDATVSKTWLEEQFGILASMNKDTQERITSLEVSIDDVAKRVELYHPVKEMTPPNGPSEEISDTQVS